MEEVGWDFWPNTVSSHNLIHDKRVRLMPYISNHTFKKDFTEELIQNKLYQKQQVGMKKEKTLS